MKKIFLFVTFIFSITSYSQIILITKTGDTIPAVKIEDDYPYTKYWINEDDKPLKIKMEEIGNRFKVPHYQLAINELDEFTGNYNKLTEFVAVGGTKSDKLNYSVNLVLQMAKIIKYDTSYYALYLRTPKKLGCSGASENYVIIKFIDESTRELNKDISKINCDKNAISSYLISDEVLSKLRLVPIHSIRFKQSDSHADYYMIFPDCLIKMIEILNN